MAPKPGHLFADVRPSRRAHDFLRDRRLVRLEVQAQLLNALGEPLLHRDASGIGCDRDALHEVGDERSPLVQVRAQMAAFAHPHRIEAGESRVDGGARLHRHLQHQRGVGVARPVAYRQRLGQPQQVAWAQRSGHEPARAPDRARFPGRVRIPR